MRKSILSNMNQAVGRYDKLNSPYELHNFICKFNYGGLNSQITSYKANSLILRRFKGATLVFIGGHNKTYVISEKQAIQTTNEILKLIEG